MNTAALATRQFRFELRSFFRNRSGMIFTLAFPLLFLFIFGLNAKGNTQDFKGHQVPSIQFFVPGIIAYGLIGATYTSLAMRLTNMRDQGVLKRIAGTPLPRSLYIAGQVLTSVAIGVLITVITVVCGMAAYGVHFYFHTFLALLVTVIIGSATFCAMGIALASIIPNADAATGIVQFPMLVVMFISDIFYSVAGAPKWLTTIASILPVRHLANALQTAFDPSISGLGFSPKDLLVMAAWGVGAGFYASRHFKWETKKS